MTVRFKDEELRPVLLEAIFNRCSVLLAKGQGVYFMSETGERRRDGRWKKVAYAVGCDPGYDFQWRQLSNAFSGDDVTWKCDPLASAFVRFLRSGGDIEVSLRAKRPSFRLVAPLPDD